MNMNDLHMFFSGKVRKGSDKRAPLQLLILFVMMLAISSCSDSGTGNAPETPPAITSIELDTDAMFIGIDDSRQPEVRVLDENGQPVQGVSVEWSSDDASVAEVSAGGVITGKQSGSTTIRAEVESLSKSIQIEVFLGAGYSSAEIEAVDREVMTYLQKEGIPGASVAVVKDGNLIHARGYGFADPETGRTTDPFTIFRYGSVSKPITAVAAMKLVENGTLSLDDKPFEILSHLSVIPGEVEDPRLENITLEQLMTHSGGWNTNRNVDGEVWRAVSQLGKREDAEMFRYGRSVPLATDPGTEYAYSNYATQAVGLLIEHATGTEYEKWVQDNLMQPLGISNVKFGETALEDREPNEARYQRDNGYFPDIDDGAMDYYGASGSWIGRATDLVRLLDGVEGRAGMTPLLQPNTIEEMLERPSFYPANGNYYAKFWQVTPSGDGLSWSHAGLADGAFAYLWRLPNGVSFAILLNQSPPGPWPDLRNVLNGINEWPETDHYSEFYGDE
jgi:N-acyl-D-amino-acid deacylase